MVPDDEDQHVKVDAFEKRCPPGMWCCAAAFCRKERSFSGSKSEGESNTQIEKDKKNLASTFEKRCPPGRWCHGGLELSVEPDMWLRSVLQAVRTRGVFRVFSEDSARTVCIWLVWFPGWSVDSGCFSCPQPALVYVVWRLLCWMMSRCRLGDLIGESAGATLPAMSAKMAIISWSETAFAMV